MNNYIEIIVIVEGQTEQKFIRDILAPYLGIRGIFMYPSLINKSGQKGGDVRFVRAINDISRFLKQRDGTFVSLFVDYYGIDKDWPGFEEANKRTVPSEIAAKINNATHKAVNEKLLSYRSDIRFIPNIAVHEFETLLFSDSEILASQLYVKQSTIDKILTKFGEPEKINNSPETAPSKRLEKLYDRYKKTNTGINIARAIGIDKMREQSPLFDNWLIRIEKLRKNVNGKA